MKFNLHWLLTGEGEGDADPLRFLDDRTRRAVETVASKQKITPEALLADLTGEALTRRAADMVANYRELDGPQIDQLHAILKLIELDVSEPRAVATGSSRSAHEPCDICGATTPKTHDPDCPNNPIYDVCEETMTLEEFESL